MHDSPRFRRQLGARVLTLLGAAWLAAPEAGCKGGVSQSPITTTGGTSQGSGAESTAGTGGVVGTGGASATGGATGAGGTAGAGGAAGGGGAGGSDNPPSKVCLQWPLNPDAGPADAGPCPVDPIQVLALFESIGCPRGWEPSQIVSGPVESPAGECCYMCQIMLCGPSGRPYLSGDRALVAAVEKSAGANVWREGAAPRLDGLTAQERARLAAAWTEDALHEHASVASFSRVALALLAVGAPADLVAFTHQAALDEVRHAQLCFALATAYAGEELGPGPFPLGGSVSVATTLPEIAASAAAEGCVGETVAAVVAAEQLAHATDPAVRAALARIADDEARHAELAWRTVAWAVQTGGAEVRVAVAHALFEAIRVAHRARDGEATEAPTQGPKAMEAHGRLDRATGSRVAAAAVADIVAPAAWALLHLAKPLPVEISTGSSLAAG